MKKKKVTNSRLVGRKLRKNDFDKRVTKFEKGVTDFEKEIDREIENVEKWVYQRRKFVKKLGLLILIVLGLLGIAYLIKII